MFQLNGILYLSLQHNLLRAKYFLDDGDKAINKTKTPLPLDLHSSKGEVTSKQRNISNVSY